MTLTQVASSWGDLEDLQLSVCQMLSDKLDFHIQLKVPFPTVSCLASRMLCSAININTGQIFDSFVCIGYASRRSAGWITIVDCAHSWFHPTLPRHNVRG